MIAKGKNIPIRLNQYRTPELAKVLVDLASPVKVAKVLIYQYM
jgi:hypothetical protein